MGWASHVSIAASLLLATTAAGCLLLFHDPDESSTGATSASSSGSATPLCDVDDLLPGVADDGTFDVEFEGNQVAVTDLAVDANGDVLVVGRYQRIDDYTFYTASTSSCESGECGFVALIHGGMVTHIRHFETTASPNPHVAWSPTGEAVIADSFTKRADIDGGGSSTPKGTRDASLTRLSTSDFHVETAILLGAQGLETRWNALALTQTGQVFAVGALTNTSGGTVSGVGSPECPIVVTASTSSQLLLGAFDGGVAGTCLSLQSVSANADQSALAIGVTMDDRLTLAGAFKGDLTLPGTLSSSYTTGDPSAFLATAGWTTVDGMQFDVAFDVGVFGKGTEIALSSDGRRGVASLSGATPGLEGDGGSGVDIGLFDGTFVGPRRRFGGEGNESALDVASDDRATAFSGVFSVAASAKGTLDLDGNIFDEAPNLCGFVALANDEGQVCAAQSFCPGGLGTSVDAVALDRGAVIVAIDQDDGKLATVRRVPYGRLGKE